MFVRIVNIFKGRPTKWLKSVARFLPTYFQYLKTKRRDADNRNEPAIRLHLLPFFGRKLLSDIRLEDGLAYLETRRLDLIFHDIRRTRATWLTQCGVDYAVIRMLRGEPLPGSAKYYIHNWDVPLRDAVTRLEAFTRSILEGESGVQVPLTATSVPPKSK